MFSDKYLEHLDRAVGKWDRTEALLKQFEMLDHQVFHPGVNELRYAGRRLIDAVVAARRGAPETTVDAYVLEVEQFCLRAQHDCVDAIVAHVHDNLDHMETTFGVRLLHQHFSQYIELRRKLDDIAHIIVGSRKERGKRANTYDEIQNDHLPAILILIRDLKTSEDVLVAHAEAEAKKAAGERKQWRWNWANISVGAAALVAAGISCYAAVRSIPPSPPVAQAQPEKEDRAIGGTQHSKLIP